MPQEFHPFLKALKDHFGALGGKRKIRSCKSCRPWSDKLCGFDFQCDEGKTIEKIVFSLSSLKEDYFQSVLFYLKKMLPLSAIIDLTAR